MRAHLRGKRMRGIDHARDLFACEDSRSGHRRRQSRRRARQSAAVSGFRCGRHRTGPDRGRGSPAIAAASWLASVVPPRIRTRNGLAGEDVMPVSDDTPRPWLSIVGIGEDGLGRPVGSRARPARARRTDRGRTSGIWRWSPRWASRRWNGTRRSRHPSRNCSAHRGKRVVALCSGDPFWYGAGSAFAERLFPKKRSLRSQRLRPLPGPRRGCAGGSRTRSRSACTPDRSNCCVRICEPAHA